ncbi:hypothetical protein ACNH6B_02320 [Shewanella basaltis]|uniref:hypothetical protein n=1 Tax=Shewanella basaltis TaxID=472183 RepID=UPI003AACB91A
MLRDNSPVLLSVATVSACLLSSLVVVANAKEPLSNEQLNRHSHSVGKQHDGRHHTERRTRHRDPWRWSVGWNTGWGSHDAWGPSIGIGWNNHFNTWYGTGWWRDNYRRHDPFYPYQTVNVVPAVRQRVIEVPVVAPRVVSVPQRTTTATLVSQGLTSLPENAKVIQRESGTVYEWQGVEYYFDWNTQTYELANTVTP